MTTPDVRATRIAVPADYELRSSIEFLAGFMPQPVHRSATSDLRFRTPMASSWQPTTVAVSQPGSQLLIRWDGNAAAADVERNVRRILSLDVDADGFDRIVDADPVLANIVDRARCVRPPLFWSPYEAAVWAVLSQRSPMTQASALKARLADQHGRMPHDAAAATPSPQRLAEVPSIPGVNDTKLQRLHAVAAAALDGVLDADRLRHLSIDEALASLQQIDGIGPFSASLILVRGAGAPDVFPIHEPRLHGIMRALYGTPDADLAQLQLIADRWRPFRSWVSFQLRAWAERRTLSPASLPPTGSVGTAVDGAT